MINKFYEKTKQFIKENYLILSFYLVLVATLLYPLPYYIYTGGGVIETNSRVEVENQNKSKGSFYFAYVSELHATLPTFLLAKIIPSWEIESIGEYQISEEETAEELMIRDKLYLEEANTSAIFNAYQASQNEITIKKEDLHIIYLQRRDTTNLQIGDIIEKIDGKEISSIEEVKEIVKQHAVADKIAIEVLRGEKHASCTAEVFELEGEKMIGVSFVTTYDYDLNPPLKLHFQNSESGPSGGLILSLTIYNQLTKEDLTKGKKIVGTGTIDNLGNVGSIGGVPYKLKGAVQNKADVFLVPAGENYEEALQIAKKEKYDIKIIGVFTFQEAVQKLKDL